jgi:hypothetical protein
MFYRYLLTALAVLWVSIGAVYVPRPIWFLALPLVALSAFYLNTSHVSRQRQTLLLLVGLFVALLLYLGALATPNLLHLLSAKPLLLVTNVTAWGWVVLNGAAVFALLTHLYNQQGVGWRATLTGVGFGGALLIALAYPVDIGLVKAYMPTDAFVGPLHLVVATLYGLATLFLLLSLGPVAVTWSHAHSDGQRLIAGALAGSAAGIIVYALLGTATAGVAAHAPLYAVAVTRVGFEAEAYTVQLGLAINQTYPFVLVAAWLIVGGMSLISGLAGWVMPPRSGSYSNTYPTIWPIPLLILAPPIIYAGLVTQIAITSLLSEQIAQTMGVSPDWWNPLWLPKVIGWQLWLVAGGVQLLGLIWLLRFPATSYLRGVAAWGGYLSGVVTLSLMVLFSLINAYFLLEMWPFALFTTLLNLALIGAGWRLTHAPRPMGWLAERPSLLVWMMNGGWAMVIALGVVYPFVAAALAMVHIAVKMIEPLSQVTAPPPGVDWLIALLEAYVRTQGEYAAVLLTAACGIGSVAGFFIYLFTPRDRLHAQSRPKR